MPRPAGDKKCSTCGPAGSRLAGESFPHYQVPKSSGWSCSPIICLIKPSCPSHCVGASWGHPSEAASIDSLLITTESSEFTWKLRAWRMFAQENKQGVVPSNGQMSWRHNISKLPFSSILRISIARLHAKGNVQKPISKRKRELLEEDRAGRREGRDKSLYSDPPPLFFFYYTEHFWCSHKRNLGYNCASSSVQRSPPRKSIARLLAPCY